MEVLMGILTPAEYQALLRQDLFRFIQRSFYELIRKPGFCELGISK